MSFGIPVRNGLAVGLLASTFLSSLRIGGRPAMFLNFIGTNSLDSRVTFTRASSATFVGSNGLIQSAAINAPRFDYSPATLAPRGLLIEEQRANLYTYSEQFDHPNWTKTSSTISANATTSPDGTVNADKIIASVSASTAHTVAQTITLALNTTYTVSVFAKKAELDFLALNIFSGTTSYWTWYNLATGAIGTATGNQTRSITDFGNGWYRCTLTVTTAASGSPNIAIFAAQVNGALAFVGDGTSGIFLYGAQAEAGAFATSYIPTVASQVTRNADVASMTGTNFSSWYNQTEGTFVAKYSGQGGYALNAKDGTSNNANGIVYLNSTTIRGITVAATVGRFVDMAGGATPVVNTTAYGYKENDLAGSTNGGAVVTNTTAVMPILTQMFIGAFSSFSYLNGHVRSISYYNTRLPNTTLRALSA